MGCFSSKVIPEGGFVDDEFPDAAAIGRIGDHHPKRKYLEAAVWRRQRVQERDGGAARVGEDVHGAHDSGFSARPREDAWAVL